MKNEYRVVKDCYNGFEVQIRRWWFPVWRQIDVNSHGTLEGAEEFAKSHASGAVKYLGRL